MFSVDRKIQLKDFAKAVAIPVGLTDKVKWPVRSGSVIFPVRNILVQEFISQIETSQIKGKPEEWRKAFDGATQIWRNSHHLVNGLIDDNVDKKTIAERILLLLEGVAALTNDHYFSALGNHYIFDDEEISQAYSITKKLDKASAKNLLSLSGLLWAYSETNFFVAHELTCEYHGAYALPDGNFMIVRNFKNLRPVQLWTERDYTGLPEYIQVVTFHDSSLQIQFDVYNNLYDEHGTMAQSIIGGYARTESGCLTESDIFEIINNVSRKVMIFTKEVNQMQKTELAHKYLEIFWYRKKSLTDYIGIDWRPTASMFEIQDQGLILGQKKKNSPKPVSAKTAVEQLEIDFDFSDYIG